MLPIITIIGGVLHEEPSPKGKSANNSFHRIYSVYEEDLSENSDTESASFNTSYHSTPRSKRIYNSSFLNNSFNSVKSLSPSLITARTSPRSWSGSVLNHSFRSEFKHSSLYNQLNKDVFKQDDATQKSYFFPNKPMNDTLRCSSMLGLNSSFRIPDDCHSKLTDLNISETSRAYNKTITCSSPTPSIISLRRQSQLLTPSRLNFNNHLPTAPSVIQTSWVAGGFFNNMSPQKRQQPQNNLLHPILSRTSSQSSGFESQTSSAHNGNANGSRESSIAGDGVSNFSEPTHFIDSASQIGSPDATNSTLSSSLVQPKPFFPNVSKVDSVFNGSASCRNESLTNYSTYPRSNKTSDNTPKSSEMLPQPVYHQFGTHRGAARHSLYSSGSVDSLNGFHKFLYHSPPIRKGSLIKPLGDNYFLDDKQQSFR